MNRSAPFRLGILVSMLTALGTVWGTIVHDDGNGIGFFMVVLAALVSSVAAAFRPSGMARGMVGVALMQLAVGGLIATAPITATTEGAPAAAMLFSAILASLWLVAAACFRRAARA